jgi:ABC-type multidrug transport system fused ATPase/permease subunit
MKNRTSIVIAHRRTALRNCDLILSLEEGTLTSLAPTTAEFVLL